MSASATRRSFLATSGSMVAGLAAACAPAAPAPAPASVPGAPAAPAAGPAWQKEWDDLVAAAKKEGKLSVLTTVGTQYRGFLETFEQAFPGITVEHTSMVASQAVPRIQQERKGNLFTMDVLVTSSTSPLVALRPEGAIDPVRAAIFRPDVLGDANWQGGFEAGFPDNEKKWCYSFCGGKNTAVWVNTDVLKPEEIRSVDDLLNPKWKGKILGGDIRTYGGGYWPATITRRALGDGIIRRLWKDQEVVLSRDLRQLGDFMVKGNYPIGFGAIGETTIAGYWEQGVGRNLAPVPLDAADYISSSQNTLFLVNKAPHASAAKLFINWILSKEPSALWAKAATGNSRRTDVPPAFPNVAPAPGKKYTQIDTEAMLPEIEKTIALAKQTLDQS